MSLKKVANVEVKGLEGIGEWTEPKLDTTGIMEVSADTFKIDVRLQNRIGVEKNDYGFFATSKKTDEIGKYLISQAEVGVSSEDALPPIVIGVLDGESYLVGGHGRLSGLMHARKGCSNGHFELFDDDETPSAGISDR